MSDTHWRTTASDGDIAVRISVPKEGGGMKMTAAHLEFVAALICDWVSPEVRDHAIHEIANELAAANPRFDRRRFVKAARGEGRQT